MICSNTEYNCSPWEWWTLGVANRNRNCQGKCQRSHILMCLRAKIRNYVHTSDTKDIEVFANCWILSLQLTIKMKLEYNLLWSLLLSQEIGEYTRTKLTNTLHSDKILQMPQEQFFLFSGINFTAISEMYYQKILYQTWLDLLTITKPNLRTWVVPQCYVMFYGYL